MSAFGTSATFSEEQRMAGFDPDADIRGFGFALE
jgi:hypothetical protein